MLCVTLESMTLKSRMYLSVIKTSHYYLRNIYLRNICLGRESIVVYTFINISSQSKNLDVGAVKNTQIRQ